MGNEQLSKLIRWAQILDIPDELLWFKVPHSIGGVTAALPAVSRGAGENALLLARWLASDGVDVPPVGDTDEPQRVGAALDNGHRYFDGPVVDFFRQQLVRCKADDGTLGPTAALPLVLGVRGAIRRHSRDAKPEICRQLLEVGANGVEIVGWLYRDLHDPLTATFLYDRAMEWAQAAGSLPLQGYVLLKKSQMSYDTQDAGTVLSLIVIAVMPTPPVQRRANTPSLPDRVGRPRRRYPETACRRGGALALRPEDLDP